MGCGKYDYPDDYVPNSSGFRTSEIVVNVTPETKSFKIEVEWTHEAWKTPYVTIDKEATTAKHNIHFVNTPVGHREIGEFLLPEEGKIVYKDVKILHEGIDEKVIIVYHLHSWMDEPEGLIKKLTVTLQKSTQN